MTIILHLCGTLGISNIKHSLGQLQLLAQVRKSNHSHQEPAPVLLSRASARETYLTTAKPRQDAGSLV